MANEKTKFKKLSRKMPVEHHVFYMRGDSLIADGRNKLSVQLTVRMTKASGYACTPAAATTQQCRIMQLAEQSVGVNCWRWTGSSECLTKQGFKRGAVKRLPKRPKCRQWLTSRGILKAKPRIHIHEPGASIPSLYVGELAPLLRWEKNRQLATPAYDTLTNGYCQSPYTSEIINEN